MNPPPTHLRIALVAAYDLARPGGINSHIRAQAAALHARGHEVVIFGPSSRPAARPGECRLDGALTVNLGGTVSGLGLNPLRWAAVRRALARGRFDVVHVHEPLTPVLPWLFLLATRQPVVGTFHVHRESGHRLYALATPLLTRLAARLDARIAVSESALATVARHFPGEYRVIPNGVDCARFQQEAARPPAFGEGRHVLFVGRAEGRKGLLHLVRAMGLLAAGEPGVRLVVVGDGPLRPEAEREARALGIDACFAGEVADEELAAYYRAADLLCAPSTGGESFGVVLLEAMAAGRPVVAGDIEGYRAVVQGSEAGLLVPPADPAALSRALLAVLRDPALAARMATAGRALAQRFDWKMIAERLERVYTGLVGRR